jgi:gluconolactonase
MSLAAIHHFARVGPAPEGIVFDPSGYLYTGCALPERNGAGPIYRVSPDGQTAEVFADTGGRVLGLAFDRRGDLFVCDGHQGAVYRILPDGRVRLFADRAGDRRLMKPNFLVFDPAGNLYVSDSGTATAGKPTGAVYRFTPDGVGEVFIEGLIFANGLALAADGQTLYVVETRDNRVLHVPILPDGRAGAPTVYIDDLVSGPDGLALDVDGGLYITVTRPSRVVYVSPGGARRDILLDTEGTLVKAPSNAAFGCPHRTDLYLANLFGDHIVRLAVPRPGLPLYHQH